MARETRKRTIHGNQWEVQPWPGMYGLRMQARWARALAPVVRSAGDSLPAVLGEGQKLDMAALMALDVQALLPTVAKVVASVLESADDDLPALLQDTLSGASVNGRDASEERTFNDHFAQNYVELYAVVAFVLEVNYGDFTAWVAAIGGPAPSPEASKEGSPES